MSMMSEFKEFAMKGSVMDLAIGVVIGGAFQKIVDSMVTDIVMPIVGLATGGVDFFSSPAGVVPPCTEQSFALGRFAIGERNGMNGVQRVIARELGESTRRIEGVLTSTDPLAIAGARVHLTRASDDAHLTRALVDATGAFDLVVPSGEVEAWVWREGVGLEGPFVVPPSGPVSIALAPTATVQADDEIVVSALSPQMLHDVLVKG